MEWQRVLVFIACIVTVVFCFFHVFSFASGSGSFLPLSASDFWFYPWGILELIAALALLGIFGHGPKKF